MSYSFAMRLSTLHPLLTKQERKALALKAGTSVAYLWQLANRWNGRAASLTMIKRLCNADSRLLLADLVAEFTAPSAGEPLPRAPGAPELQRQEGE